MSSIYRKFSFAIALSLCFSPSLASEAALELLRVSIACPAAAHYEHRRNVEIEYLDRNKFFGDNQVFDLITVRKASIQTRDGPGEFTDSIEFKVAFADIDHVRADLQTQEVFLFCKGNNNCIDQTTVSDGDFKGVGPRKEKESFLQIAVCSAKAADDVAAALRVIAPAARSEVLK